jgi:tRNA threonylcarbamoyladenosine biosynthesis protein TsaE
MQEKQTTQVFASRSAAETQQLGETFARRLRAGDLVTLHGELGAGKTTFVQGVARALEIASDVVSPTFVLIAEHEGRLPLLHLDAYRLENLDWHSLQESGIFNFLEREDAVKIVEWPSRIEEFLPVARFQVWLRNNEHDDNARTLEIREHFSLR